MAVQTVFKRYELKYTSELNFAVVILSSPELVKGETYTITVGTQSGDFEAS